MENGWHTPWVSLACVIVLGPVQALMLQLNIVKRKFDLARYEKPIVLHWGFHWLNFIGYAELIIKSRDWTKTPVFVRD